MQEAIIGHPISDKIPLLHELIVGPFDADKLDYMPRDAHMSGVPIVTDIPRLIQKTRALFLSQDNLPNEVAVKVKGDHPFYTLIGIDLSGGRTLDELMLGRVLLFDKIYRHQKVRAAEGMVASLLYKVSNLVSETPCMCPYVFTDEELLDIDKTKIEKLAGRDLSDGEDELVSIAVDLAWRLKMRKLFVRSFAFAKNMPFDPYSDQQAQKMGLVKLIKDISNFAERQTLVGEIAEQVMDIASRLKQESLGGLPLNHLESYICISPPESSKETGEVVRAYLITSEDRIIPFREESAESRGWADAYLLARDLGYIFAPAEISQYVYLAAEKIIRTKYDVRIPNTMLAYAKQKKEQLEEIKVRLDATGYYDSAPYALRPLPQRLSMADITNRLNGVVVQLAGYYGPVQEGESLRGGTLTSDRVKDWIRQFQSDEMVDAALRLIERIRLIGRREINEILVKFLESHEEFRSGYLCPWGLPKDSSALTTYWAVDVSPRYELITTSLADALNGDKSILFVDDFIGQGHQTVSVIENWFGLPQTFNLREDRGKPLTSEQQDLIRSRPIAVLFAAGWSDGANVLKKWIDKLNLNILVSIGVVDDELPHAFNANLFKDRDQESKFCELCKDIGYSLLLNPSLGHDKKWAEERSLGYGNRANLVVFPYNTPTQTLTCMWAKGEFNGIPWTPLFPRRKKQ
jgi:ribosomal protein S16